MGMQGRTQELREVFSANRIPCHSWEFGWVVLKEVPNAEGPRTRQGIWDPYLSVRARASRCLEWELEARVLSRS